MTDVNNKSYSLEGGIRIPEGADLYSDTYKVPGNYYCPLTSIAKTLKNCPCTNGFTMKVEMGTGTGYPQQIFKNTFGEIYFRIFNVDIGEWKETIHYLSDSDIDPNTMWQFTNKNAVNIPENADMKSSTYLVPGVYKCDTDVKSRTLKNCPATSAFTLFVYRSLASHAAYLIQEFRSLHGNVYKRRYSGYDENIQNGTEWGPNIEMAAQQLGTMSSNYMELTSSRIVKTGGIVVASANYKMKQTVTGVNPLISLSFKPATYVPVHLLYSGNVLTGNIWLNTSGNVGIGGAVTLEAGKDGSFVVVYPAA